MTHAGQQFASANNPQPKDDPGLGLFAPVYNFVQPTVGTSETFYVSSAGSDVDLGSLGTSDLRSSFRRVDEDGKHLRVSFKAASGQLSGMLLPGIALKIPSDVDLQACPLERESKLRALIARTRKNAISACILCCCCSLLALKYVSEACREVENNNYDEAERLIHKSQIFIILGAVIGTVMIIATVCSVVIVALFVN